MRSIAGYRHGFSLVELSIVLVILGLLVGGVLSGQALIRAAELRSITTELSRITTATKTFQDKYFALPGDFTKATHVWGRRAADPTCINNAGASSGSSCDGNGNGMIDSTSGAGTGYYETSQFWMHLRLSGLLDKSSTVTGMHGSGQDYPSAYTSTSLWGASYNPNPNGFNPIAAIPSPQNVLTLGAMWGNSQPSILPTVIPQDAYNIDTKLDDGKATTGFMVAAVQWAFAGNLCVSGANYPVTNTSRVCSLMFMKAI